MNDDESGGGGFSFAASAFTLCRITLMIVGCPCCDRLLAIVIPVARMFILAFPTHDKDDMDERE
jgi:hypothetical protein